MYFIKSGEVQVSKQLQVPQSTNQDVTITHQIGLLSRGHILGLEEAVIGKRDIYTTSACCVSETVELLRIETETFRSILKPTPPVTTALWK